MSCIVTRIVVAAVLVVTANPAAADAGFAWRAPSGCPSADDVRSRIEARLETAVEAVEASIAGIEVSVDTTAAGFVATIDARAITVANAVRTLTSERCDALADAVALIVVRLANEAIEAREARATHAELGGSLALELPARAPSPRIIDPAIRERADFATTPLLPKHWGLGIQLLGLSGIGVQPHVSVGAEVGTYVRRRDLMIEVAHARWMKQSGYLAEGAPGRIDVSLSTYTLRLGWSPERMPIRGWAMFEVGTLRGEGVALFDNRMGSARWTAAGAGFGVGWPIARLVRLVGAIELGVSFDRPRFMIGNTEVHRPAAALARTSLGLEVGWR